MNSYFSTHPSTTGFGQAKAAASFSDLVQRIVQSNSGRQRAIKPQANQSHGREWEECRTLAEESLSNHNYARAEAMWLKAVSKAESLPTRDWRRVYSLENLISLFYSQARYDEAEVFADRYAYVVQAVYGIDHAKTGDAFNFLASIYFSLNRLEEASDYAIKALSVFKHGQHADQTKLGMVLYNLAVINHTMGDFNSADQYYCQAFALRKELYGEDHPHTEKVVESYNEMLADKESHEAARKIINRLMG